MEPILPRLPADFWTVPYAGSRFPGAATVADQPGLTAGGNCQLFAYEVLGLFGLTPPPLRSSELWDDTETTVRVSAPQPLDLLLFNASASAYGAHVGVWAGDDAVLHLCAEVGHPTVWGLADFAARERYRVLVGTKRVIGRSSKTPEYAERAHPEPEPEPRLAHNARMLVNTDRRGHRDLAPDSEAPSMSRQAGLGWGWGKPP